MRKEDVFKLHRLQLFAFDSNDYCDFTSTAANAIAGKDILLCIWSADGSTLYAISGQQGLTINRSADTIEITAKDTLGGYKSYLPGMKEWSIDNDGLFILNDQSHQELSQAFENGTPVCIKVVDAKHKKGMFGGLACVTDYPLEAPYDDAMTYSLTLSGMGALVDLQANPVSPDTMPEGTASLEPLTVVSVAGASSGQSNFYVNPVLEGGDKYFYKTGAAPLTYPAFNEVISQTAWNGTDPISGLTSGNEIMIIETNAQGQAVKAGVATITTNQD